MTPQDERQQSISSTGAADTVREQDKVMLVLAYLGIFALIPLLTVKDSPYVQWHAKQGVVFAVAWFICSIVGSVIPIIQCVLGPTVVIGGLVLMVMSIMKALAGVRWRIPVVADLADKF
jgi:uncharacterized membrane protein